MKLAITGLILIGVAAAVCAAMLVTSLNAGSAQARADTNADSDNAVILVASRGLEAVSVVSADALVEKPIDKAQVPKDALTDASQVVGRVLAAPMVEGQTFTTRCFATHGPGMNLAAGLPEGKRAVTITVDLSAGLEGLLYPGAVVDVLASFRLQSKEDKVGQAVSTTLLQSVQVLAVGNDIVNADDQDDEQEGKKRGTIDRRRDVKVTLLVDNDQAKALQLATGYGEVSLAMRNPLDKHHNEADATVLSGGQLAALAQLLKPTIDETAPEEPIDPRPVEPAPTPVVQSKQEDTPAPAPAPPAKWDVIVVRGTQSEIRSFDAPTDPDEEKQADAKN